MHLEAVDLVVGEGALVGAVGDAEAVGGLARLRVRKVVYELDLLHQIACRRRPGTHDTPLQSQQVLYGVPKASDCLKAYYLSLKAALMHCESNDAVYHFKST